MRSNRRDRILELLSNFSMTLSVNIRETKELCEAEEKK